MYDTKAQFSDPDGWYSKISLKDKEAVREAVAEEASWLEQHGLAAEDTELSERMFEFSAFIQDKAKSSADYEEDWTARDDSEL